MNHFPCIINLYLFVEDHYTILVNKWKKLWSFCLFGCLVDFPEEHSMLLMKQKYCHDLNICFFLQIFILKLNHQVRLLGGEKSGRWLGCESRILMNGIVVLIKQGPESYFCPYSMQSQHSPSACHQQDKSPHQALYLLVPWCQTSQFLELHTTNFYCMWTT